MISKLDLERAWSNTRPFVRNTPFTFSEYLSERWECEVFLKHEQKQGIGAFKIRGASNFLAHLSSKERERGLVTHSSGNHAQAVAFMARLSGIKAHIVMPKNSNSKKIENANKWGANIYLCEPSFEARLAMANELQAETGAFMIPPFDHERIIEGQATVAMEMIRDQRLDYIIAPLGGGGLLSGSALASKYFSPSTKVIGAEPELAKDGYDGFIKGVRVDTYVPNTLADGLRTLVGEIPFEIIKHEVSDIWLASESRIIPWMYKIWEEEKTIIEPSCAVPFAAIDANRDHINGKRIGIIITGGNVDLSGLPPYSTEGL